MSDNKMIFVPFEGEGRDRAVLLLEAAEKKDLPANAVQTTLGGFLVPEEVEKEAFGGQFAKAQAKKEAEWEKSIEEARDTEAPRLTQPDAEESDSDEPERKAPAKKAEAKKSTTKAKE